MLSRSISIDFEAFIDFFIEIPSPSSESFFSVSDVNEPNEPTDPRFVFVNEFVLTMDFDRVITITTSARGDYEAKRNSIEENRIKLIVFYSPLRHLKTRDVLSLAYSVRLWTKVDRLVSAVRLCPPANSSRSGESVN